MGDVMLCLLNIFEFLTCFSYTASMIPVMQSPCSNSYPQHHHIINNKEVSVNAQLVLCSPQACVQHCMSAFYGSCCWICNAEKTIHSACTTSHKYNVPMLCKMLSKQIFHNREMYIVLLFCKMISKLTFIIEFCPLCTAADL